MNRLLVDRDVLLGLILAACSGWMLFIVTLLAFALKFDDVKKNRRG